MAKSRDQYIVEHGGDSVTFSIVDEATVARLQREGDITLPAKKIDVSKDERWNTKLMSSKLLQGILNGDSIPNIASSLISVIGNNKVSAIRNARTMVTQAENSGRLDSYDNLAEQGVVQKKVWIATPDDRTRQSHLDIDGEEVDIDAEFSNGLMYPGDPTGDPEEVWNCRCSMRDHIVGFRRADGSISYVRHDRDDTTHDKQMEEEKERRGIEEEKSEELEINENISNDLQKDEPVIGGNYNATPEMIDLAMEVAEQMQGEFPELLSEQFEIRFDKYMGNNAGEGFRDYIALNGAHFKKRLKEDDREYLNGVVAHELTHTMQSRLNTIMGIKGEENRDKNIERIMDNAIVRYVSDNPDKTVEQINKTIANAYGGGGHSGIGSRADEKMAVSIEHIYSGETDVVASVGKYVVEELKLEISKLDDVYRRK